LRLSLYFHTLRFLRPVQIFGRIAFRFRVPRPDLGASPARRALPARWHAPIGRCIGGSGRVLKFLNVEREVGHISHWNDPGFDRLWLYNLHYFDLLASSRDRNEQAHWVERWIVENPPAAGAGWEPYPTSLRIVNWIKWSLAGNALSPAAVHSLAIQTRWLLSRLEWHLLGNHLLANAKALIFAGCFFEGVEADAWLLRGQKILQAQLREQVLADGGHYERSPMYHAAVLEDVLDVLNVLGATAVTAVQSAELHETASRMLGWLQVMTHPDGEIAFFNDAAFGISPRATELSAYARRLGVPANDAGSLQTVWLPQTGYLRVAMGEFVLFLDAAPVAVDYQPGHAHADTLSFELSWQGQRVLCNSGTSCYGTGPQRTWERSTRAHNTVEIDGENSSEVWHGFRVARRARPFGFELSQAADHVIVSCSHDGYTRLSGKPIHNRRITISRDCVSWIDTIAGGGMHTAVGTLPVHPDVRVEGFNTSSCTLKVPLGSALELEADDDLALVLGQGTFAPEFGIVQARPAVSWKIRGRCPMRAALKLRVPAS